MKRYELKQVKKEELIEFIMAQQKEMSKDKMKLNKLRNILEEKK